MTDSAAGSATVYMAGQVLKVLARLEKTLCIAAFAVLVVVLFADVLSRELSGAGLHWASQIGVWANVFVVMAGFGLASANGAHLRPRFLDKLLSGRAETALAFLQHFCMALFCAAIGAVSFACVWTRPRLVLGSWRLGEVEISMFLPVWPVQAMLPLAFFAGALRHALYAFFPMLRPADSGAFDIGADSPEERQRQGSI